MDDVLMGLGVLVGLIGVLALVGAGMNMPTYGSMVETGLDPVRTERARLLAKLALVAHGAAIVLLAAAAVTAELTSNSGLLVGVTIGVLVPALLVDAYLVHLAGDMQAHHDWLRRTPGDPTEGPAEVESVTEAIAVE